MVLSDTRSGICLTLICLTWLVLSDTDSDMSDIVGVVWYTPDSDMSDSVGVVWHTPGSNMFDIVGVVWHTPDSDMSDSVGVVWHTPDSDMSDNIGVLWHTNSDVSDIVVYGRSGLEKGWEGGKGEAGGETRQSVPVANSAVNTVTVEFHDKTKCSCCK